MKEKIIKIIENLHKEFEETQSDIYFKIKNKEYYTDTGYALEGIEYFVKELKERIENTF